MTIDRRALVDRHQVVRHAFADASPMQVGNGSIAFGTDLTGLQSFPPFATTMSSWGWHEFPGPPGRDLERYAGTVTRLAGRERTLPYGGPDLELAEYLSRNPHRLNLGRIGLELRRADGAPATRADILDATQRLDAWTGRVTSRFRFDGAFVEVETWCDPDTDTVCTVVSTGLPQGSWGLVIDFPAPDNRAFTDFAGDWDEFTGHRTEVVAHDTGRLGLLRTLDATRYGVTIAWDGRADVIGPGSTDRPHRSSLLPRGTSIAVRVGFRDGTPPTAIPGVDASREAAARAWESFWLSGGAIELADSTDERAPELERRVVLSQYQMRVNASGPLPPQEGGLATITWSGRFHLEMIWWHLAHWSLWGRDALMRDGVDYYRRTLSSSMERARTQDFSGARWPKNPSPEGREAPHPIHAMLIWQQPHPMFFAELEYRADPSAHVVDRWAEVLDATADFMASFAHRGSDERYHLGPPVYEVGETTDPWTTVDPAFELAYWRFGLRIAAQWRARRGLRPDQAWETVLADLAPLPAQDGVYVLHAAVEDMWTQWTSSHPAIVGAFGWLPGDGVDRAVMDRTLDRHLRSWQWDTMWGWDPPMLAMCAARLGRPGLAVDFLLQDVKRYQFDDLALAMHGLAPDFPIAGPYFPANGGLLYAVAMMARGWDGAPDGDSPGFPADGWRVRHEGLRPAL